MNGFVSSVGRAMFVFVPVLRLKSVSVPPWSYSGCLGARPLCLWGAICSGHRNTERAAWCWMQLKEREAVNSFTAENCSQRGTKICSLPGSESVTWDVFVGSKLAESVSLSFVSGIIFIRTSIHILIVPVWTWRAEIWCKLQQHLCVTVNTQQSSVTLETLWNCHEMLIFCGCHSTASVSCKEMLLLDLLFYETAETNHSQGQLINLLLLWMKDPY